MRRYVKVVGNKMHKAFPLPVIRVPTGRTSEATARKIELLSKVKKKLSVKITKDSILQCLCCVTRFLILSFFEITQSGESLSIHISLSLSIQKKKWINNIPPLPKYQSWIQENSSNGSSGYNNIFNMSTMPCGSGNEATKRTKKNILKQQYGNFKAEGSETLEQMFTRLQVIVGQLRFMDVETEQDDLNQKFLTSLAPEWLMHTIGTNSQNMAFISSAKHSSRNEGGNTACVPTASTNVPTASASVATISQDTACAYIVSQSSASQIKFEEINQIDEDDMEEMDIKWNMALLSMRADKWVILQENAKLPKTRTVEGETTTDRETLKEEKEGVDGKLAGLLKALKDLDNLIESQRSDKIKDGLGYSAVLPPPAQLYLSSKKDLSWTGLSECADDTVTDYSRPSPTVESTSGDDQNKNPSISESVASPITPKPFIKFVKPKDSQSKSKTGKTETPKKPPVKNFPTANRKFPTASRKFPTGSTKCSTADMGIKGKAGSSQNNIDDKGYWDSGCSRHMTGNISYLSDYEPFNGGYVSFGQGGCKIPGKRTIKTGKLEFENVYFVKDLKMYSIGKRL
nr:hypothetical protein [Tanacetum cinerariifolium]